MIPFVDLKQQYQAIKEEIDAAVLNTMANAHFVLGPEVAQFEADFSAYCGATYGVAVNSGTSALHLALLALGIGPGDEVITVPFTFVATVAAILYTGARAVLVDVDPHTWNMDPGRLEAAITSRTRAVLPVHLHGCPADMPAVTEIASRHGIPIIEDVAQAHGAEIAGRRCGSIGDLGCFSFYPGKNLGAYGEGGMVVTSNEHYADKIRMLRDWGQKHKYLHEYRAFNYRMEGIQGAILGVKLRHLDNWTESRRRHAALYRKLLAGSGLKQPPDPQNCRHVYHIYAILVSERERLQKELASRGIQTNIHYPIPVHLQPGYADLGYRSGDFPVSEALANTVLSLPMFPELTDNQLEEVAAALRTVVRRAEDWASANRGCK
jgi:dTDP-4-amino-4,6-dideoxygalactose transaminase